MPLGTGVMAGQLNTGLHLNQVTRRMLLRVGPDQRCSCIRLFHISSAQVKVEEQNSDERSGTEEDSDNAVNAANVAFIGGSVGAASGCTDSASINDYNGYENIFRCAFYRVGKINVG